MEGRMWGETESVAVTNECALLVRKWLYGFVCVCIIYTHICVFKLKIFLYGFYISLRLKIVYVKKNYLVLSFLSWSLGGSNHGNQVTSTPVTPDRRGNMGRKVGENKEENNTQMAFVEITVAQFQGDR